MASELKPCPLCSADPSSKFTDIKAAIWCEPCGLHMEYSTAMVSLRIAEEHQRSILTKRWNTRPTAVAAVSPDATGKCGELVTVETQFRMTDRTDRPWGNGPIPEYLNGYAVSRELVTRSQADELLAEERHERDMLKADFNDINAERQRWRDRAEKAVELLAAKDDECKYLKSTLSAWFDTKKITEDSLKPLMVAAVKGYLRTCSSGGMPQELIDEVLPAVECMIDYGVFAESVTQYTMSLKADNAALTARIKHFEDAIKAKGGNEHSPTQDAYDLACKAIDKHRDRAEALETKLAAAEKALEPFAEHANDRAVDDTGWRDKETVKIVVSIGDLRKARAALGGKPS